MAGATVQASAILVDQDRERIGAAPRLGAGDTLSVAEERRLYEHYGLAYSESESPTVLPEGEQGEPRVPRRCVRPHTPPRDRGCGASWTRPSPRP